jgi:hypothetical protein
MGSAMAAGVAGLLPARLLQTKALLLLLLPPSSVLQPARFALTYCAVVSSWLLAHSGSCYTLPATFIEPHIEIDPRITSRSHTQQPALHIRLRQLSVARNDVSRQGQARRRCRSPLPRGLATLPSAAPCLQTFYNPLLARSRARVPPRVSSPISILRRGADAAAQTARHSASTARPCLRRAPSCAHPHACAPATTQPPWRAAVRRGQSALELQLALLVAQPLRVRVPRARGPARESIQPRTWAAVRALPLCGAGAQ